MLSLRSRLFVVISIVVLVILGISIFLVVMNKNKQAGTENTANGNGEVKSGEVVGGGSVNGSNNVIIGGVPVPVITGGTVARPATSEAVEKNAIRQMAKIFVERYNTFSSENNFQNIKDVEVLVTPELWARLSNKMKDSASETFVRTITNVVSSEILDQKTDSAVVKLSVTKSEEKNGTTTTSQATVEVALKKISNEWLINSFTWQK